MHSWDVWDLLLLRIRYHRKQPVRLMWRSRSEVLGFSTHIKHDNHLLLLPRWERHTQWTCAFEKLLFTSPPFSFPSFHFGFLDLHLSALLSQASDDVIVCKTHCVTFCLSLCGISLVVLPRWERWGHLGIYLVFVPKWEGGGCPPILFIRCILAALLIIYKYSSNNRSS